MGEWSAIDSRQYILAFELPSADDCPADFHLPPSLAGFDAGLFLPRDDPDWFGRSAYPPRVMLLTRETLRIVPHPGSHEELSEIPMGRISCVESGHMLLKGWLRLMGSGISTVVRYNTRGYPAISRFQHRFREMLLPAAGACPASATCFGAGLDIKFGNALKRELAAGENVAIQFFQPPRVMRSNRWPMRRRQSLAGDLLVRTDRRLMWVTDRDRGFHSRYGSIASYAPLRAAAAIEVTGAPERPTLAVHLQGDACWNIPIAAEELQSALQFAGAATLASELDHRIDA